MLRSIASAALLALALAGSACSAKLADTETQTAALETRVPFVDVALSSSEVALTKEQRTQLEAIRADLATKQAAVRTELRALGLLLADALDAGKLDRAAADAQAAKVKSAAQAVRPDFEAAIAKTHDLLDPSQRQAIVAAMKGKKHGPPPFLGMLRELDLSSDQKAALRKAMHGEHGEHGEHGDAKGWKAHHEEMRAALEGFAKDSYDPKAFQGKGPAAFAEKSVAFVSAAIDVLDAGQRAKLAASIRARAKAAQ